MRFLLTPAAVRCGRLAVALFGARLSGVDDPSGPTPVLLVAGGVIVLGIVFASGFLPARRSLRVMGWRGSGGKLDWEYVVEVDGTGCAFEVGEFDVLAIPRDEQVRTRIEQRTRSQVRVAPGQSPG